MSKMNLGVALFSVVLMAGCAAPGNSVSNATGTGPAGRLTVGDIMAKGGRQLTAVEMKQVIPGATLRGSTQYGNWTSTQHADGKYSGQFSRYQGGSRNFHGDWRIDDRGRNCALDRTRPNQSEVCTFYYALDGRYFATEASDPGPDTVLEDRTVTR